MDLFIDLQDGHNLITLLEVLTHESLVSNNVNYTSNHIMMLIIYINNEIDHLQITSTVRWIELLFRNVSVSYRHLITCTFDLQYTGSYCLTTAGNTLLPYQWVGHGHCLSTHTQTQSHMSRYIYNYCLCNVFSHSTSFMNQPSLLQYDSGTHHCNIDCTYYMYIMYHHLIYLATPAFDVCQHITICIIWFSLLSISMIFPD